MRIHVSFIDRVGITQEVLALLGGRNLNLDAVEMVPPNVYIDAPTLSPQVLEELRDALFNVQGVQAVTVVDILPGQRRHLQLDALLAAMTDPVLALDSAGTILLANPALVALYGREPAGENVGALFADPALLGSIRSKVSTQGEFHVETMLYSKSGQPRWVSLVINASPEALGGPGGSITVLTDITLTKMHEVLQTKVLEGMVNELPLPDLPPGHVPPASAARWPWPLAAAPVPYQQVKG